MHEGRQRLGKFMAARRAALGLSQREAAERAGFSEATWQQIETVKSTGNHRANIWAGICRALEWEPGTVDIILSGGEPVEASDGWPDVLTAIQRDDTLDDTDKEILITTYRRLSRQRLDRREEAP